MENLCDLCQYYSPSGCAKLSNEVCIKEAFQLIKENVTNGDVIKTMFPSLEIEYTNTDEYTNKPRCVKLIIENTIITEMSADRWDATYRKAE